MLVKCKGSDPENTVKREQGLIKISTSSEKVRSEIIQYANIFRGGIIDVSLEILTVEITGAPEKIVSLRLTYYKGLE